MLYSELLHRLKDFGVEQVGKLSGEGKEIAYLGRPQEIIYPVRVQVHPVYLEPGEQDPEVHPEEVAAILRRFGIDPKEFGEQHLPAPE